MPVQTTDDGVRERECRVRVDRHLCVYLVWVFVLTAISLSVLIIRRHFLHRGYPENTLLFVPDVRFTDFVGPALKVEHFGEPGMITRTEFGGPGYGFFPYPLPAVYVYLFFIRLFSHPLRAYMGSVLIACLTSATLLARQLPKVFVRKTLSYALVFTTLITAFPFYILLDRGNIEGIPWMLTTLAVFLFYRRLYVASAVLIAAAGSLKLFPLILLLLFLAKKQCRAFWVGVVAVITLTLLAWAGIGPTILQAARDSSVSSRILSDEYIVKIRPGEIGWDHSIFACVKQVIRLMIIEERSGTNVANEVFENRMVRIAGMGYAIFAVSIFPALYWFKLRVLPVLNQLIALLILSVLLPFISGEYTLVYMYIGWAAFLLFLVRDVRTGMSTFSSPIMGLMLVCFAIIFSAQSYWLVGGTETLTGPIKSCVLLMLLWAVIKTPMSCSSFETPQP